MKRYRKGADAKIRADTNKAFLRPKISEREAAGRLTRIPGMVEAEATKPIQRPSGVRRLVAKGFSTGFLDIVELRTANIPMTQSIRNMRLLPVLERGGIK